MKNFWISLLLLCLLTGCGAVTRKVPASSLELPADRPTLWTVMIGRGDREIFSGLLALRQGGGMLRAVLLDPTGIKLLELEVQPDGSVQVSRALPALKGKRLAPFLGEGLHRIFNGNSVLAGEGCRRDGLARLCLGEEAERPVKSRRFGPFVLWRADYLINNYGHGPEIGTVRLESFWPAPFLELHRSTPGGTDEGRSAND